MSTTYTRLVTLAMLVMLAMFAFAPIPAFAHAARSSSVLLDIHKGVVTADLELPLEELRLAMSDLPAEAGTLLPRHEDALRRYTADHLRLDDPDVGAFALQVGAFAVGKVDDGDVLRVRVTFTAPLGAPMRVVALTDDLILHHVATHQILVSVRQDFGQAVVGGEPKLVGISMYSHRVVTIHREGHSDGRGFRAVFELGMRHIAGGTDHLLFLLMLLLPAPLTASPRRWSGAREPRAALASLAAVVTAFTVGHSISLVAATLGVVTVKNAPVEILIAVSIGVAALHALRPLFPGREAWVALGFGFVHGFAFAEVLRDLGLRGSALATALAGFNLGIEAMQLAVVGLTVPWLVLLARTPVYAGVRVAGALVGAVAAAGWGFERVSGKESVVSRAVAIVAGHPLAILVALATTTLVARAAYGRRRAAT